MSRRLAREVAFRTIFQLDAGQTSLEQAFAYSLDTTPLSPNLEPFARQLIKDALAKKEASDQIIRQKSVDWEIDRLPRVDLAILRLALGELLAHAGTPTGVIINEAIELAHKYSTEESSKYINGLLGNVARERPDA